MSNDAPTARALLEREGITAQFSPNALRILDRAVAEANRQAREDGGAQPPRRARRKTNAGYDAAAMLEHPATNTGGGIVRSEHLLWALFRDDAPDSRAKHFLRRRMPMFAPTLAELGAEPRPHRRGSGHPAAAADAVADAGPDAAPSRAAARAEPAEESPARLFTIGALAGTIETLLQ